MTTNSKALLAALLALVSMSGEKLFDSTAEESKGPFPRKANKGIHNIPADRFFQGRAKPINIRRHQSR